MGGWSGGVYTRFRNWVTDKANSINPQAALFDQEDDGFAAGLNNCVTKDGLNKPSSAMDWNGQNLSGILNLSNTGTVSLGSGKATLNSAGNLSISAASSGFATLTSIGSNTVDAMALDSTSNLTSLDWLTTGSLKAQASYNNSTTTLSFGGVSANVTLSFTTGAAGVSRMTLAATNVDALKTVDDAGSFQTVGWRDCPLNQQNSNYQLVFADRGKMIRMNGGTTVTIPPNSLVPFPDGTTIVIVNNTVGNISIGITTDILILAGTSTTGTRTLASNGIAVISKSYSATQWSISGTGVS
jgi:hypothetical protein